SSSPLPSYRDASEIFQLSSALRSTTLGTLALATKRQSGLCSALATETASSATTRLRAKVSGTTLTSSTAWRASAAGHSVMRCGQQMEGYGSGVQVRAAPNSSTNTQGATHAS